MEKLFHRLALSIAFVLASGFSALCWSQTPTWSAYGRVISIMQFDNGNIHFWTNFPRVDISGCGGDRYVIAFDNSTIKQNYAGLLAALHTQLPVRVYVNPGCIDGNPTVRLVQYGG